MKLVINNGKNSSMESMGDTLHALETGIHDGKIVAIACVGNSAGDNCSMFIDSVLPTSRLKIIGAVHHLLHNIENGEDEN